MGQGLACVKWFIQNKKTQCPCMCKAYWELDNRWCMCTLWLRAFLKSPWTKLDCSWHETVGLQYNWYTFFLLFEIYHILQPTLKCSDLRVNSNDIPFGKLCWAQQVKINCSCCKIISTQKLRNDSWSETHYLILPLRIVLDYIKNPRGPNNSPSKLLRIWWMKLQHMK